MIFQPKKFTWTKCIAAPLQRRTVIRGGNKRLCTATPANLISLHNDQDGGGTVQFQAGPDQSCLISDNVLLVRATLPVQSSKLCAWHALASAHNCLNVAALKTLLWPLAVPTKHCPSKLSFFLGGMPSSNSMCCRLSCYLECWRILWHLAQRMWWYPICCDVCATPPHGCYATQRAAWSTLDSFKGVVLISARYFQLVQQIVGASQH